MKNRYIIGSVTFAILILLIGALYYWGTVSSNSIRFYDEEWMRGKTMEEIESRYGSCEVEEKGLSAYGETIVWIYTLEEDRESWLGDTIYGTKLRVIFNLEGRVIGTVESSSGLGG